MTDLYEKGTVIEVEIEGQKNFLLCSVLYNKDESFLYRFTNITPNSEEFGKHKIWDSNTKYFQTAVKSAKKLGKLNDRQIGNAIANPDYAKKILENLLK